MNSDFFVAGGTMMPDAPSYIERQADRDLYECLLEGKYCYVLTARQTGKSSLIARTAVKLREVNINAIVVDLASIGRNLTVDQWYGSLLSGIAKGVNLNQRELEGFWASYHLLSPVQRWLHILREKIMARYQQPLVVFIDEVDYVLNLPFPMDEFFAAIRECYNMRAEDAIMRQVSFSLVGVATPSDLIRDSRATPFNIGRRIELHDFTREEAAVLTLGLKGKDDFSYALLTRVLHWTGGHPFLTQRLCQAVASDPSVTNQTGVDRLCRDLFLTIHAQETDDNLLFVRRCLLCNNDQIVSLLDLYAKIRKRVRVLDDYTNSTANALRLSGITRTVQDCLQVRNRIYKHVFNEEWIKKNMPDVELRRQKAAYRRGLLRAGVISGIILFLTVALAYVEVRRQRIARETAQRLLTAAQPQMTLDEIHSTADVENLIRMVAYRNQIRQAQEALGESNINRVEELLRQCIPKDKEQDLRGFEWRYIWESSHQESQLLKLEHPVASVRWAPDGGRIAIAEIVRASEGGKSMYQIGIYGLDTPEKKNFKTESRGIFNKIIFTPDLQRVLVDSNEGAAKLLEVDSGESRVIFKGNTQSLSAMDISHDGRRVVTADARGGLQFWEVGSETKSKKLEKYNQRVLAVSLSPDGKRVVVAIEKNAVDIWDFSTGRILTTLNVAESVLTSAVFFPDGGRLASAAKDGVVYLWNLKEREVTAILRGHSGTITAMALSTDGEILATGSDDRTVRLWNTRTGRELITIKGHGSSISDVSWASDSKRIATGSLDGQVKIWDVEKVIKDGAVVEGVRAGSYFATAFSKVGDLLAVAKTGTGEVKILRVPSGEAVSTIDESASRLQFATFSHDAEKVATSGIGTSVRIWDVRSGRELLSLMAGNNAENVYAAAFSYDGNQLAFVYDDHTLKSWDSVTGQELFSSPRTGNKLSYSLSFSPNGKNIAAAYDNGDVVLWNTATRQPIVFKGHKRVVRAMTFSPDSSNLATSGQDNVIKLWDVKTGRMVKEFGQADLINRMAFSPDGKRLITGGYEGTVKVWDVMTGQELLILYKHANEVTSISFFCTGESLGTSSADGSVKLWRLAKSKQNIRC